MVIKANILQSFSTMDYEQQARNFCLMGAIRNGDLLKVRDLLNDGADINFVNQHGNNETPLHIAVLPANLEMIKYLLEHKADGKAKTKDGKKPIDFCEYLDDQQAALVRTVFNEHYSTCKSPKDDQHQQLEYDADSSAFKSVEYDIQPGTYTERLGKYNKHSETYAKRPRTAALGAIYEIKILTMVLFRLLHNDQIESFYLATNLEEAGYFDDVILRTYDEGKPRVYLLQVKHRSADRPINFEDMINKKGTSMRRNNGFDLDKYFESYLNIRYMHSRTNDNPIFQGLFDQTDLEMIIYTNAKINYEENVFYDRTNNCNLVYSKKSGKSVQIGLTHELIDHFTKLSQKWHLKTISDIVRRLTKIQNIDTSNLNSDVIESHRLETILKSFFKNNYDVNGLNLMEQYGNPDLLSAYTRNTREINESIANMIDEAHLPTLDYHVSLVEEFFGKLRIYSEQAAENEMEEIIKNEIQAKHGRSSDVVFSNLYSVVESWWNKSGSVPYLTKSCSLLESVQRAANFNKDISLDKA